MDKDWKDWMLLNYVLSSEQEKKEMIRLLETYKADQELARQRLENAKKELDRFSNLLDDVFD
jgi:DNA polymerase I-like protein with 3'-5' exonuclease and polymerase domains